MSLIYRLKFDIVYHVENRGFHKLDEIGNDANIGMRVFTT